MYVANEVGVVSGINGVLIFPADADGDAAYAERINGGSFGQITGIAIDANRNVYVANGHMNIGIDWVAVYAAGAHGDNVAPIQTIQGGNTGIVATRGVAVDANRNIYVANEGCGSFSCVSQSGVLVFAAGANGDVEPIRSISGARTQIGTPEGIALDGASNVYVVNGTGVVVYAAGANGNVKPIQSISGSNTGLTAPTAIAVDPGGTIYVANGGSSIDVFAPGASGNVAPARTISGDKTGLASVGVAVDASGIAYSADEHGAKHGNLRVFAAGASGNVRPIQIISGRRTGLTRPRGIAVR
jgi:hypothetical protein